MEIFKALLFAFGKMILPTTIGGMFLWSVYSGLKTGCVCHLTNGIHTKRENSPKAFYFQITLNLVVGLLFILIALYFTLRDLIRQLF